MERQTIGANAEAECWAHQLAAVADKAERLLPVEGKADLQLVQREQVGPLQHLSAMDALRQSAPHRAVPNLEHVLRRHLDAPHEHRVHGEHVRQLRPNAVTLQLQQLARGSRGHRCLQGSNVI